jgi:polyisoprenoid-binding protein YceI
MSSRTKIIAAVAAILALLLIGGAIWWYSSDDAPEKVSLESATEGVDQGSSDNPTTTATVVASLDGQWTVDTESGEFDFESATGSFAGYRIQEEFAQIGANEAVGRTGEVLGTMEISDGKATGVDVEVDMTTLTSNDDSGRRDGRVQEALGTGEFPTATFSLTEPIDLGESAEDGTPLHTTAKGELTVHGVTKAVEVTLDAQLVDGTIVVVGSIPVNLGDYEVTAPTAPIVLSVSEDATVEMQLLFTRA